MSSDEIPAQRPQPAGAIFYRCALQVNPHSYAGTFRGQAIPGDLASHARDVIAKAVELGISVLAIADHNDASGVVAFREAAAGSSVVIFPGFELKSTEGVHVLCIYPADTAQDRLGRFLGEFGIHDTEPSDQLCGFAFDGILQTVHEQGGIAIAAHVTNEGGLLRKLSGQTRARAWKCPALLAIQIPGSVEDLPQDLRPIVRNDNPEHRREHAAGIKLAVAVVNAADVVTPADLEKPSSTTWIKMSSPSIEGLRQAFLDPDSRIRLHSDSLRTEHAELLSLGWETEGFLKGLELTFNPNLNVLIGGRGTGKSTIVESIRAVLGLDPLGEEASRTHRSIVQHVLRSGTRISLRIRVRQPAERIYLIERTLPNPPLVKDEAGTQLDCSPRDVLPAIEVYGQHEISELTRSSEKRTRLLHRFVKLNDGLAAEKARVKRELERNRRSYQEARRDRLQIEAQLAALPGLEHQEARFREAGIEEKLKEQSLLIREQRILDTAPELLKSHREILEGLQRDLPIDVGFLSAKALEGLPGAPILEQLKSVMAQLDRELRHVAELFAAALSAAEQGLASVRSTWDQRKLSFKEAYERTLRELQQSNVDGAQFLQLRTKIEQLRPLRERLAAGKQAERDLEEKRRSLRDAWENLKAEELRGLQAAAKKVSRELRDRVAVTVEPSIEREALAALLREHVKGMRSDAIAEICGAPDLSLPELADAGRKGIAGLQSTYGVSERMAELLVGAGAELWMKIEELELPATTSMRLNIASIQEAPVWQDLEQLSTGQKATAVLLLLLLESDAPLIVDQPEDDLDNRFISEEIVPRMREAKQRRQFIFSTHNANIPVLGDAELILGLSAAGEAERGRAQVLPEHRGSIDDDAVRILVEEILEGGKDAFERRRRKYGF